MTERRQISRDSVLKEAIEIAVRRSINQVLQNAEQLLSEAQDWDEPQKRLFLSSLQQAMNKFENPAQEKAVVSHVTFLQQNRICWMFERTSCSTKRPCGYF
jgi:hypothetical protein